MTADPTEVTLGEVGRGLDRVEREMRDGIAAIRAEIKALAFVPAAVYAADQVGNRERIERLEEADKDARQRAWQSRWSIVLALIAMPISIVGAVIAALVIAALK